MEEFKTAIAKAEDKIFANFCSKHGFDNVRVYEELQGNLEDEVKDQRQKFDIQANKLQTNLNWQDSRLKDTTDRVKKLDEQLKSLKSDIKSYQAEKTEVEQAIGQEEDELNALQEHMTEVKEQHGKKAELVAAAKAEVDKRKKEIDSRDKEINRLETTVQSESSKKSAALRKCKMEQIPIPLASGSLDDIPDEDNLLHQDPDAMDVDEEEDREVMRAAMDDHGVEIDYDGLDEDLKTVSRPSIELVT